jgi:hypothetical protein
MGLDTKPDWLTDRQSHFDFEFNQLWDIRHPVTILAEDFVRICYQETTSEDRIHCAVVTVIFGMYKPVRIL